LRWVGSVGLNKELHEPLQQRLRAPVREIYGTTETGATAHMPVAAEHMVGSGSCGLPVAFRECMIADGQGGEAVRGRPGELWVAGPGILEGYYGRPEVDAEVRRGRWFRTGDLARQDREGYLYIVGRIKDVIRRGGENVSAAEVEAVLTTMPEVLEAAAVPVPDPVRGEEVKVYLALCPPLTAAEVPPARVMAHCRRQLARFKLPRYLEYVDRLPRTASDKIAKAEMVSRSGDPRRGSYDFAEELWR
ncbi:MAG: long-chain fatty acid--CoA ligase, partial [Marmoricola sp.]|nr:long-chain fatty acid--CoA ligase [Marmoricola sp.]